MAINVDTVYKTVLLILNKEQRGYITPNQFNKISNQVQLEIFDQYFDDFNQQLRAKQTNAEYSNRVEGVNEKIASFKALAVAVYDPDTVVAPEVSRPFFDLPDNLYKIGTVAVQKTATSLPIDIEELSISDFYIMQRSDLTAPSENYPVYVYQNNKLFISPLSIDDSGTQKVLVNYVKKPQSPQWGSTTGTVGQLLYNQASSVDFELMPSEQTTVITKILLYAGVVIKDPQVVQLAAQQIQSKEANEKS